MPRPARSPRRCSRSGRGGACFTVMASELLWASEVREFPRAPIAGVDRGHDAPPSGSGRRVVPSVTGIGAWPSWLGVGPAGMGTSASLAARAVMASRSPSSAWRSSSVTSSCSSICSTPLLTSRSCPLVCSWGGRRGRGRRRGGGGTWRRSRSSLQHLPLPGTARRCSAQQARPASVPCPPRPGSRPVLVPAERDGHRCWLVGGRKPGPNRPTQPAWNWTLPGASCTVTFAER
jgi:hypothetical protein